MIHEKLQNARIILQNKNLKKTGKNKYSGFTYYDLSDILPAINQIFMDLKLSSNFSIKENQAILTVTDWEDNSFEEFLSPVETLDIKGCSKIQALGGIHTYMKRYLYLNALEIVENDMFDPNAGKIEENKNIKTVSEPVLPESDPDLDLLQGLYEQNTTASTESYYKTFKDSAINKELFKSEYAKHYLQLKRKEGK
ncbi:TPA: hypothetical protein CPT95_00020 [Candidatus Gastranaerophilales bacterium HUM_15]|jgi:hypothetical protein|nr:MAG TPA: hypothetical protein CPT95_00020 [Candidatus Gastranaerophilales bacterium HUM_15]